MSVTLQMKNSKRVQTDEAKPFQNVAREAPEPMRFPGLIANQVSATESDVSTLVVV